MPASTEDDFLTRTGGNHWFRQGLLLSFAFRFVRCLVMKRLAVCFNSTIFLSKILTVIGPQVPVPNDNAAAVAAAAALVS